MPFTVVGSGIEAAAKPVLEWLVPRQKLGLFMHMAQHEMVRAKNGEIDDEQLWQRLTESWDNVDNRLGQLVYDNLFWNKTLKDGLMLAVRSVGWNLGSWREYGGVPIDILTTHARVQRGDAWLSQKIGYAIGAVVVYTSLGAVIMYVLTGMWPEEPKDYFFPKTGYKNPDGSDERLSLPTYAKDWYAYADRPFETLNNKTHPIWSTLGDLWQNEDFFNVEIRHPDDPLVDQMQQVATYMGEAFLPFSVRNYQRMRQSGEPTAKAALTSAAGIISAPRYLTRSPAQKLMMDFIVARLPQGTRTRESFERSQLRKHLIRDASEGRSIFTAEAREVFTGPELAKIKREARIEPFARSFKRLTFREALLVYQIATDQEREQVQSLLAGKYNRAKRNTRDWPDQRELYRLLTAQAREQTEGAQS